MQRPPLPAPHRHPASRSAAHQLQDTALGSRPTAPNPVSQCRWLTAPCAAVCLLVCDSHEHTETGLHMCWLLCWLLCWLQFQTLSGMHITCNVNCGKFGIFYPQKSTIVSTLRRIGEAVYKPVVWRLDYVALNCEVHSINRWFQAFV